MFRVRVSGTFKKFWGRTTATTTIMQNSNIEWNALINPVVIFKVSELTHRRVSIQVCETQQDSR